ncbi:MAG: nitroreductase family protein [Oscillospiraceae bacterium]|nr:nitroreductase family protein [Oscillospiraceae bacterium]
MDQIIINEEKCVGCGLCVEDCPNDCISLVDGRARFVKPACIECGHCFAICPQGAVGMSGYDCPDEPAVPMTVFDGDTLLAAMRSRRTVRHFAKRPVEDEKIRKILEAGRYSPTGGNFQGVAFTILGSRQAEAEAICVRIFRDGSALDAGPAAFLKRIGVEVTDDFFFKGAPLVIVVSGADDVNPALASSYMELMAESLGLGVLFSGFFRECASVSEELRRLLELPEGHRAVTCMVMGYPAVGYKRIVPRKPLKLKTL